MQEDLTQHMSVTEHVHEACRLLLQLPDGERKRVTEHLAQRYAWSEVEAGTTAMRRDLRLAGNLGGRGDGTRAPTGRVSSEDELEELTADLTPADVFKVRVPVEALRDGVVTVAQLHGRPDGEWMDLISSRRRA